MKCWNGGGRADRHRMLWPCLMAALAAGLAVLVISCGHRAHAQDMATGGTPLIGLTGPTQPEPARASYFTRAMDAAWSRLAFEQRRLTQHMTGAVRDLKSSTNVGEATGALVIVSFIYGFLHSVGPGHGKAVISSYMLADKETLRRGILLAFLSSMIQAVSAIVLVGGLYMAAVATGLQTSWAEAWLETMSWGFIAFVGACLMFKQLMPIFRTRREARPAHDHAVRPHSCACEHDHLRDHGRAHGQGHDHDHDGHCAHAHLPAPQMLKGDFAWRRALAISFSIGIRPCTGALLVIIFAASQGMIWAGVIATFAMAFGTALTVSALAALSVGSRRLAILLAGAESHSGKLIAQSASIVSSAAVFVLGTAFFFASLHDVRPF